MREDVLKVIRDTKDVTNAVILTHNIDFVFVQSVVIPALRKCGSPALTIFADADCAAQTYQYQARALSGLGLRYRVVSVSMKPGFRFHPKAVLLSGPQSATLLVGSGNLTFGGWKENGEVWSQYSTDTDGSGPFAAFDSYLREVAALSAHPNEAIASELREAFDAQSRTWAADMADPQSLLGRAGKGSSMLEQMKAIFGDDPAEHLYVCAPYFDDQAEALQAVAQKLGAASTTILVQSMRSNLLAATAAELGERYSLRAATFEHKEQAGSEDSEQIREAFLHAKFYAAQRGDEITIFAGSANCSRAALTIPGSAGNAELMAYATISRAEFERAFLDELVVENSEPELAEGPVEDPPDDKTRGFIRINAADIEDGQIHVAYQADAGTHIESGLADDTTLEPVGHGDGWVKFRSSLQRRSIVLIGSNSDVEVRSFPHWIDDERALRASARGRSLAESIHDKVRGGTWGIGAWTEVLSELHKHLQYMPLDGSHRRISGRGGDNDGDGPVAFEWDDVFADDYGLSIGSGFARNFPTDLEGKIGSLRSLLLRWYGVAQPEADQDDGAGDDATPSNGGPPPTVDEGDDADKQTPLPKKAPVPKLPPPASKELKRASRLVTQVAARLADPEFLSERSPELLAADLRVAAVLLRAGLADEWLTEQEFFDATLAIWLPLFFNAAGDESTGWLEQRYLTAPQQHEFAESLRSVELAAALGCWAFSTPAKASSAEHARFDLASALGVARLPWLWQTGGNERIAKEIAEVFIHTSRDDQLDWKVIEQRWLTLIRRGYALEQLGRALATSDTKEMRGRMKQMEVGAGELLWQGRYGFCIAKSDCARADKQKGEVLILQQGDAVKTFMGPFLMPVSGLLEAGAFGNELLPDRARRELITMVDELRVGLMTA